MKYARRPPFPESLIVKTVFFDIDTQMDFLYPAGALYVPAAEKILPMIQQLNRHAAARGITLISSMDAHAENDPEFRTWPPHCIAGTLGGQKAPGTLLDKRVVVPNQRREISIDGEQQVIVEKQTLDVFETANLGQILSRLDAGRFVIYGVVTEYCVKRAAAGLQRAGYQVVVVSDAVQTLNRDHAAAFLDEFRKAGGEVAGLSEVCAQ
jgi:nicotinamidase/pyrazinamidase